MNMLRHFYNDFMALVPLQLPQLIDVTTMEKPQFYGDYVLLTFPLRDSYDLEEVMDMFEDDMELITDEDWACDESFEPTQRSCPNFEISDKLKWEEVLEIVVAILKDLLNELADLNIFRVEHIAVGFVDGDLIIIK